MTVTMAAKVIFPALILASSPLLFAEAGLGIACYECDSSRNFTCTEFWDVGTGVADRYLSDCSHVFEATHCVKMTGVFDGKLGEIE